MVHDLLASRDLAWQLLIRDLSAQYRQSFLGFFWAFLPPIVTAAGLTIASNAQVINIGETNLPYPAYVMFSMTLWQTFTEAVNGPVQAVAQSKTMLTRINFPREAIVVSRLGQLCFNFAIKLILIVGLFIWFRLPVPWTVIVAPVALIHLICLGTFIGLLLSPLGLLYQDVTRGLTLFMGLWLFATPVIYPPPKEGLFATIVQWNPVTPLLTTTRDLATTGIVENPQGFWIASGIAFIGLLCSWIFYRVAMPYAIERVSS
jgi:lipopolysaccharide transport system permease protein